MDDLYRLCNSNSIEPFLCWINANNYMFDHIMFK